jgi:hypothetical protein
MCAGERGSMWSLVPKKVALSQFMYFVFTCRSLFVYEDTIFSAGMARAYGYSPTIKVYQHKLNKKEFKLAFKL